MSANEKALRRRVAQLEGQLAAAGVVPIPNIDLPNSQERDALINLIVARYPKLDPRDFDKEDFAEQFDGAMRYLATAQRKSEPDVSYATSFWCDQATQFLRRYGVSASIKVKALSMAVVASRVPHTTMAVWPYVSFGLSLGDQAPSALWRTTLRLGVPQPAKLPAAQSADGPSRSRRAFRAEIGTLAVKIFK